MKKDIFSIILILLLFVVYSCKSHRLTTLENRFFYNKDSIKINSLSFFQDNICIYTQEFLLPIDEKYKKIEIKSKYEIKGDLIFLKNIDSPPFLLNQSCFSLPDSIREIFISMFVTNTDTQIPPRLTNDQFFQAYRYGYINGIKGIDTLEYRRGGIFYGKVVNCYYPEYIISVPVGECFTENGEMLKYRKKIFSQKGVTLNKE